MRLVDRLPGNDIRLVLEPADEIAPERKKFVVHRRRAPGIQLFSGRRRIRPLKFIEHGDDPDAAAGKIVDVAHDFRHLPGVVLALGIVAEHVPHAIRAHALNVRGVLVSDGHPPKHVETAQADRRAGAVHDPRPRHAPARFRVRRRSWEAKRQEQNREYMRSTMCGRAWSPGAKLKEIILRRRQGRLALGDSTAPRAWASHWTARGRNQGAAGVSRVMSMYSNCEQNASLILSRPPQLSRTTIFSLGVFVD